MNDTILASFFDELEKISAGNLQAFWEGAKHEVGPALGAVLGAGGAKVIGVDPLAGAAAGYGIGAAPSIIAGVRERLRQGKRVKQWPPSVE